MTAENHQHIWVEKRRVTEPDESGTYILTLWDEANYVHRKVPSVYSECECGDSLISPVNRSAA